MTLTRRSLLQRSCLAAGAGLMAPTARALAADLAAAAKPQSAARPARMAIVLSFAGGSTLRFEQSAATRLDDYVGEHVHQQCYVLRKDLWTVFFRPDADGVHDEIVVERGCMRLPAGQSATNVLDPYSASILRDGNPVAQVKVPYHWWWSRWRWQTAPRPVVRQCSDLISARLLPPYGPSMIYGMAPYGNPPTYAGPMDSAGIVRAMGDPGDRQDIGLFTNIQAEYIIRGSAAALEGLFAQVEATGSMPIHWRDETTETFADFQRNPTLTSNLQDTSSPHIPVAPSPPRPPGQTADVSYDERYWGVETAHTPNTAYLPYLLTDDPYFLEETQALANMAIGRNAYHRILRKLPGLVYPGETRSFAWSFRDVFEAALVSPVTPPAWLLSKAYWTQCVADNRKYAQLYQDSPARVHKIFHTFSMSDYVSSWQNAYVATSLGFARYTGAFPEWDDFYVWFLDGMLPMALDGTGWSKAVPMAYYFHPIKNYQEFGGIGLVPDGRYDATTSPSWEDAFAHWQATTGPGNTPAIDYMKRPFDLKKWDGDSIIPMQSDADMYLNVQGAFHLAKINKVPNADKAAAWMDHCMPALLENYRHAGLAAKWSFG